MGYGVTGYGTGPYAAAAAGPITVVSARVTSTHTVIVTVSAPALRDNGFTFGSALNPNTWQLLRLDTNQFFSILEVVEISSTEFELRTLEPFAGSSVVHEVSSTTLRSEAGALVSEPNEATFFGVIASSVSTPEQLAVQRKVSFRDVANPPTPEQLNLIGGTLRFTSGGDYALEEGEPFVRKLILRRLVTPRGGFLHLPSYGIGFAVKEPVPVADLIKLRAEIERQVKLEPEVEACRATLTLDGANGILTIVLRVRLRPTGAEIEISLPQRTPQVVAL